MPADEDTKTTGGRTQTAPVAPVAMATTPQADQVATSPVGAARARVDALREELRQEQINQSAAAAGDVDELKEQRLNAEGDRLQAELDRLRSTNRPS